MPFAKTTARSRGDGGEAYELPPADKVAGVLVAIIDLGTQHMEYQGESTDAPQVFFVWELTGHPMTAIARNHLVGFRYRVSLHKKAGLRKLVEDLWSKDLEDSREYDMVKEIFRPMLGKSFLVDLEHKKSAAGNDYARIKGVGKLPSAMPKAAPAKQPLLLWEIGSKEGLPDWLPYCFGEPLVEVIRRSPECSGPVAVETEAPDEEAPF